ncbi:MAG: ABC transporter permease [Chloroflexi bacterium]|nr:ABC transporter permease [Chloroflexota bacterium]MCL5076259.1 ABC transporter permease [Chloroflexota bacterium]
MRNILALTEKEIKTYFVSPVAYVVMAAFLVVTGFFFAAIISALREASMRYLFYNMSIILLLLSPIITMRLLAEEQRSGTIELLLTNPVRDAEVVLGKFLASLALFILMLVPTALYSLLLFTYGDPDGGPIITGYIGLLLIGAAFLSFGLLASSLTQNQIIAAVISFGGLLVFWFIDALSGILGQTLSGVLDYLSLAQHFYDFPKGVIESQHIVFYVSFIIACLFLTTRSLETRRWR